MATACATVSVMRRTSLPTQPIQKMTAIREAVRDRNTDATAPDFAIGVDSGVARAAIAHARQMAEAQQAISNLVRRQAVVALKHEGLSVREIAKELKLSHSDVHRLLSRSPDEFHSDARPLEDAPFRAVWGAAISGTSPQAGSPLDGVK